MDLEDAFHRAMVNIYERAKRECRYSPNFFLRMVGERGGLSAARALLGARTVSDGFTRLWELGRLDLSVEALILQGEWRPLFSDDERQIASQRLAQMGYQPVTQHG
jgi:hypothetical protein